MQMFLLLQQNIHIDYLRVKNSVLRIRVDFFRIRIRIRGSGFRISDPDPDPDPYGHPFFILK